MLGEIASVNGSMLWTALSLYAVSNMNPAQQVETILKPRRLPGDLLVMH